MPFLVLLLGVLLAERGWRWLFGLLLVPLSLAVNALGILVDFNQYLSDITRGEQAREAIYLWQPAYSPILAHIRRLDWQQVPIVSFHLSRSDIGFPEPAATLLSAATVALTLGALAGLGWLLWQSHRAEHASSVQQVATNV
jgi:MFS family permease